jgi:peptidoglycan/LPS O-acetylase OafA/YrhL
LTIAPKLSDRNSHETYRPEIDGLRAIAVVAVIFFHAGVPGVPGGFVGVDVFFVISGFLITSLILEDQARGQFALGSFYARRARRILPALTVMLLACTVPALLLMSPAQQMDFFRMMTAVALFFSNVVLAGTTGYFDGPAEERPLLHTWSLSVEEQYYFLFPLLLLAGWKLRPRRLATLLVVLAIASLALAEAGWRHYRGPNFFFTPSRVWELLAGSLAAFAATRGPTPPSAPAAHRRQALALVGLVAIGCALLLFDRQTPTPSLFLLAPVGGTVLVLLYGTQGTWTAKLLSVPPLVGVGLVSYSAYLWHQPLLAFAKVNRLEPLPAATLAGLVVATFTIAFLSWRFVEQPVRRAKHMPVVQTLIIAIACSAMLALMGVGGRLAAQSASGAVPASVTRAFQPPPRAKECFDIAYAHSKAEGWACGINAGAQPTPTFVVFGDSHALQVLTAFEEAGRQAGRSGLFMGFSGCAPLLGVYPLTRPDQATQDCHALNERVLHHIRKNGLKQLILVAKWSYYTDFWNGTSYINAIGLRKDEAVTLENSRRAFREGVLHTVQTYKAIGVNVVVIEQVPQQAYPPPAVYDRVWSSPGTAAHQLKQLSIKRSQHRTLQTFPTSVFEEGKRFGNLTVLNFDDLLCEGNICPMGTPGTSYYQDQSHLSDDGAKRLVPGFARLLAAPR